MLLNNWLKELLEKDKWIFCIFQQISTITQGVSLRKYNILIKIYWLSKTYEK